MTAVKFFFDHSDLYFFSESIEDPHQGYHNDFFLISSRNGILPTPVKFWQISNMYFFLDKTNLGDALKN